MNQTSQRLLEQAVFILRSLLTLLLMTGIALVMLCVASATLFQARRFYSERIATPMGRLALKLWGIQIVMHQDQAFPRTQTVYISNHTSTIDVFVLIALGLPRARFFLSGFLRKILPLGLIGYLIGIFWTVPQSFPERRARIFQRAEAVLRSSGDSVYLSPEGERITSGEVGHFNKGAFHLATRLHCPIVPLFIAIPSHINPGRGLHAKAGEVHVYVKPSLDTRTWREEDVVKNKEAVRDLFVVWNREHRQ